MKRLITLLSLMVIMVSCQKQADNITINMNSSGNLNIRVLNDQNDAVAKAHVMIYSTNPENERLYYDSTDNNGICSVGKLLQGQYYYSVSAKAGKITYYISQYFQVIAAESKTVDVNPFENVGKLSIMVIDYQFNPIPNINVALLPYWYYSGNETFDELMSMAYFTKITDSEGWAKFEKVPASYYSLLIYFSSTSYFTPYQEFSVYRDEDRKYTVRIEY